MKNMKIFALFAIILFISGCTVDSIGLYSRMICRKKYDNVIDSLNYRIDNNRYANRYELSALYYLLADVYYKKNELNNSLSFCKKAVKTYPKYSYLAFLKQSQIYKIQGNKKLWIHSLNNAQTCLEKIKADILKSKNIPPEINFYIGLELYNLLYLEENTKNNPFIDNRKDKYIKFLNKRLQDINIFLPKEKNQ